MRLLKALGVLWSFSSLVVAAPAPAGISLDVRDDANTDCGVTTIYVTAPIYRGGFSPYSMTFTRTVYDTAFVTKTVGKSTTTGVVEITVSSPGVSSPVAHSEISAIITDSAFLPISSEIPVEETTTLRTTQTRTLTRTLYETTTDINGDVEVNPVTVIEVPVTEITSAPQVITRLSTWTRSHTTTILTTTTLPNGEVVVTSYTATNDALAPISMGKQLHDGPVTSSSATASSEEPEETYGPDDEVVVVSVTRVVQPLITLPPPVETSITETYTAESTETSTSNGQPVGSPHAPFPIFTAVESVPIAAPAVIDYQEEAEKTTTLYASTSITLSRATISTDSADAFQTSVTSTENSSYAIASGGNYSAPTLKYSGAPLGWNNTYSTMTKVYAAAPTYGYDHLSREYSATSAGFTAPVQSVYQVTETTSSVAPILSVPAYSGAPSITSDASVDPVFFSLQPTVFTVVSSSQTTAPPFTYGEVYGNPYPYISVFETESHSVLSFSYIVKPSSEIASVSDADAVATSSAAYADKTSHSSMFSHAVTDLPYGGPSYATPTYGGSHTSSSESSSAAGNATMTTASRDGESSTLPPVSVEPTTLEEAPSFIPTVTSLSLPPFESSATVSTSDLPASIVSLLSSVETEATASHSEITAAPSGLVAPSFSAPPLPTLTGAPTTDAASVASSSTSSTSAASTSCGEQGPFSLNFDDIPPLVGDVDQPLPISSPYKHFFFSEGFAVGPPPRIPFVPETAPLILQFQTQPDVNVTRNHNNPAPGEYGATGEIGNGPNMRWGCYSFDAVAAYVGCDSLGPDCEWQFTGVTYNSATNDYDETFTQFATTPGCPAGEGCALTDVVLLDKFENIQSLRINATVGGVPKIWWMDNLQLRWADDSCDAGICRASHR